VSAKILVVDDEPGIQALIEFNLQRAGYDVLAALDAEEARRHIEQAVPDLMLLDWNLPGMSGLEFLRRLRAELRTRNLPIIMLSARTDVDDKVLGLISGTDDYMSKPFSPKELLARIQALLRCCNERTSGEVLEVCELQLDQTTHRVAAAGRAVRLGPTEFRLLHFLMAHAGRMYSRTQLLDHIWGGDACIEERTVDVHIRRLRVALQATGHDALIQTVRRSGYRFSGTPAGE
jgi:two-component system phosphate regulon response regulator PhoB